MSSFHHCATQPPARQLAAPLIDIAVNLADCVFVGVDWKGKQVHPNDFHWMMERTVSPEYHRLRGTDDVNNKSSDTPQSASVQYSVPKCLISGTSLVQCARAIRLCRMYPKKLYCTIGVHPANSSEFLVPITDEERRYVEVNGGLLGADREVETPSSPSLPVPSSAPSTSLPGPSTTKTTRPIEHFTTGGPLRFDSLKGSSHETYWLQHGTSEHEAERLALLERLITANRDIVAAVGECGLDGAELDFCPFDVQTRFYRLQLAMAARLQMPLFLHSRDSGMRFVDVTRDFIEKGGDGGGAEAASLDAAKAKSRDDAKAGNNADCAESSPRPSSSPPSSFFSPANKLRGVVHSFTGDDAELMALLTLGGQSAKDTASSSSSDASADIFIGINGSAFRTEASARRSSTAIPLDRLLLETDAPWCDIRKGAASKGAVGGGGGGSGGGKVAKNDVPSDYGAKYIRTHIPSIKKEKLKQSHLDAAAADGVHPSTIERRNEPCFMINVLECYVGCRREFLASSPSSSAPSSPSPAAIQSMREKGEGEEHCQRPADSSTDGIIATPRRSFDDDMDAVAMRIYQNTISVYPLLSVNE